ncbi:MAG: citrate synthase family protein [Myxococcota bacterium]
MTSDEACARLGVKKATLYSYAARGLIRRVEDGRRRLYVAEDVERVALRAAARRGHGAVAAGALRWGEPVLDSAITHIDGSTIRYRGVPAIELARRERYERVCEHLWNAEPGPEDFPSKRKRTLRDEAPVWRMVRALPELALRDPDRLGAPLPREHERARGLIASLAAVLGGHGKGSIAARLGRRFGHEQAIDRVLILCADHELNVSSFASRVAASSGADLYACVGAALYAFTGPKHGAACDRVEALSRDGRPSALRDRLARGESVPGFGHPLYPKGDPRTAPLLEVCASASNPRLDTLRRHIDEGNELGLFPTVDLGVVAVALACEMPAGMGAALFALGRVAGWVAHALEQRETGGLLRPRARYVGVDAS